MSVQVENLEKNMAKLTIEVPAEELEKALEKAYQKQKKNISVPGFRKGKVPRAMVEKMYGPAVFYEDAVNSLVPEEYSKAAEESKLDIVSRPEINVEQIEKGKAFIFTATVAVKPEVTLGEYKGLEVAKADTTVTDEEVEAELKKEQEKNARTINVEDRPAADGDTVTLDFEAFCRRRSVRRRRWKRLSADPWLPFLHSGIRRAARWRSSGRGEGSKRYFPRGLSGRRACWKSSSIQMHHPQNRSKRASGT